MSLAQGNGYSNEKYYGQKGFYAICGGSQTKLRGAIVERGAEGAREMSLKENGPTAASSFFESTIHITCKRAIDFNLRLNRPYTERVRGR